MLCAVVELEVNISIQLMPDFRTANFAVVRRHLSNVNLGKILNEGDENMLRAKFSDMPLNTCQRFIHCQQASMAQCRRQKRYQHKKEAMEEVYKDEKYKRSQ